MTEHTDPRIPDLLAAAWGIRARPSKGPKPGLSIEVIVRTAMRVAADEGLGAVTMNRVATELGTAAMSLYRYVSGKDELLILMMDGASGPPPEELWHPREDWRRALAAWSRGLRAIYLDNLWLTQLPISSPPATPNHVAWMECGLRAMGRTSLAEADKLSTLLLLIGWVRADTSLRAGIVAGRSGPGADEASATFTYDYGRILTAVADPERFPAVRAVLDAGVLGPYGGPYDGEGDSQGGGEGPADDGSYDFEFGLQRILDGVQFLITNGPNGSNQPGTN